MYSMFLFGVDYIHPNEEPAHDPPSLALPKREIASSFSWSSPFKSPTPRTLCLGESTLKAQSSHYNT